MAFDPQRCASIWFGGSVFEVPAYFYGWRFYGSVNFDGACFEKGGNFFGALFERDASFTGARFTASGEAADEFGDIGGMFQDAIFRDSIDLNSAKFYDEARVYRTQFHKTLDLQATCFSDQASFQEAEWRSHQRLFGPILLRDEAELNLRRAACDGDLLMEVDGGRVNFNDTRLGGTLTVRARGTGLTLEQLDLTHPALLSQAPDRGLADEAIMKTPESHYSSCDDELPKILSLRDSNVLNLTIASADMQSCLFSGVRNVDRLSIEGYVPFSEAPSGCSDRRVICEESAWRRSRQNTARSPLGRRLAASWRPAWLDSDPDNRELHPDHLARIYHGLRKSLEDSKDYSGASDFYYGEMEMRRRASGTPIADRTILAAYWLLSGYGLRATRSLLALVLTLGVFAVLFMTIGFTSHTSLASGLLQSARSVALLPQAEAVELNEAGQAFQIALRVIGPVLIGLTALALRARIKR